ncbi:hypothetical protein Gorai_022654 [Gossypium raimondii]|uniref:Uncharacterized protein n=1 Tax=Gossypium raimondii TaxID=29730 RepID=A0A7J8NU29_GOSRA|nr:hypothetical protein [Gossypium raimondii]
MILLGLRMILQQHEGLNCGAYWMV